MQLLFIDQLRGKKLAWTRELEVRLAMQSRARSEEKGMGDEGNRAPRRLGNVIIVIRDRWRGDKSYLGR